MGADGDETARRLGPDDQGKFCSRCIPRKTDVRPQRNKGRVVSDIVEADIAVLAQDFTSKNFDHWNKIAIQNKKVAVQSRYIRQCVKDCALLDPDEFGVVAVSKPRGGRGRGRPPGAGNKRQEIPIAPPSPRAFRLSASPPPPKRTEGYQGGKFLYTSEETEYFRRYVPILVSRDPDVSNVFIGDKLHEKVGAVVESHPSGAHESATLHRCLTIPPARGIVGWRVKIPEPSFWRNVGARLISCGTVNSRSTAATRQHPIDTVERRMRRLNDTQHRSTLTSLCPLRSQLLQSYRV